VAESVAAELVVEADLDALSAEAARRMTALVVAAMADRGRCTVALAGGKTPERLYRMIAGAHRLAAPWQQVEWFWGDERCVPPDDAESNYRMARDSLLAPLHIASDMAHRIRGEQDPDAAAAAYDALLRDRLTAGRFDLVLLGLGADGHTASLFPGSPALEEGESWAIAVDGGAALPVRRRVTLTYPVLDQAGAIFLLVSGTAKHEAVARILAGDRSLPAARLRPAGTLVWLMDRAARDGTRDPA
jgi:6-phosphogluconolactonase